MKIKIYAVKDSVLLNYAVFIEAAGGKGLRFAQTFPTKEEANKFIGSIEVMKEY